MVRIPTYDNERTIQTGSEFMRRESPNNYLASGLNELASGLGALGKAQQKLQEQGDRLAAEKQLLQWERDASVNMMQSQENMPEDGRGFHDMTMAGINKSASAIIDKLPENLRAEYELKFFARQNNMSENAAKLEFNARQGFLKKLTSDKADYLATSVSEGFVPHAQASAEADEFLNGVDVAPEFKKALRQNFQRAIDSGYLENLRKTNPELLQRELGKYRLDGASDTANPVHRTIIAGAQRYGVDPVYMLAVAKGESNFNPNTANSKTIYGVYQMTAKTRAQYGVPENMKGDVALETSAFARLTKDNQERLAANGIPVTGATLWGMHFLGSGGFIAFAKANPNTDAYTLYSQIAGPSIANQAFRINGGLMKPGMTVGQVLNGVRNYYQNAEASVKKLNLLEPRNAAGGLIKDGEIEIAGVKLTGSKATDVLDVQVKLTKELSQRDAQQAAQQSKKTLIDDGVFDRFDPADRKRMDEVSEPDRQLIQQGDTDTIAKYSRLAAQGYLPKPAAQAATALIASNDQAQKALGYELLAQAHAGDAVRGLDLPELPGEVKKKAEIYTSLRTIYRMSPVQAAAEADRSTAEIKSTKADEKKIREETERRTWSVLDSRLKIGGGWFDGIADAQPLPDSAKRVLEKRFQERYMFHRRTTGSEKGAEAAALLDMKQAHGKSYLLSPNGRFMLYPPEGVYPKGEDGTHKYVATQALDHVNTFLANAGKNITDPSAKAEFAPRSMKDIEIVGNADTARDVMAGRYPRYEVFYKDKRGAWQYVPGAFVANPTRGKDTGTAPEKAAATAAPPPAAKPSVDIAARRKAKQVDLGPLQSGFSSDDGEVVSP